MEPRGLEPLTPCLQSRCATNCAKAPGGTPGGGPGGAGGSHQLRLTASVASIFHSASTCRRARVVSEPLSEYQQWVLSSAALFTGAGEDIRYAPRPRLTRTSLPGSGDFYVFDDNLVMFLHYAGNGTNTAFEITDEPHATRACQEAFASVWQIATPLREYRPA